MSELGEADLDAEKMPIVMRRDQNMNNVKLSSARIEKFDSNGVSVDSRKGMSRAGVYAAGDVTGTDHFVHVAAYGAKIAATNASDSDSSTYHNAVMPAVVFAATQAANVGLTEVAAKAAGYEVRTSTLTLDNVPNVPAARDTPVLFMLVADETNNRRSVAHLLALEGADNSDDDQDGYSLPGAGRHDLSILATVERPRLAAQSFDMNVKSISCCAGQVRKPDRDSRIYLPVFGVLRLALATSIRRLLASPASSFCLLLIKEQV